jgi:putative PIN family toxin of toxin-antitoxin system
LAWLRALWTNEDITPLVCRETTVELMVVLGYPKFKLNQTEQMETLEDYLPFTEIIMLPSQPDALPVRCRDPKDEKFIRLALAAKADYLVTGDADLLALRGLVPFEIITIDQLKMRFL